MRAVARKIKTEIGGMFCTFRPASRSSFPSSVAESPTIFWPGRAIGRWPEFPEKMWSEFSEPARIMLFRVGGGCWLLRRIPVVRFVKEDADRCGNVNDESCVIRVQ